MRKIDPEKVEAKRRQILDAAIECFARNGFHGTSTASICAAAGMSPGNLFHYFPTKASIIEAIALEDQRITADIFAKWFDTEDAVTAIEEIALEFMQLASDPVYVRITIEIGVEATRNADIAALFAENESLVKGRLAALVKRGIAQGRIDRTLKPDLIATWLLALTEGAFMRVVSEPGFKMKANTQMLRLIIQRMLQPQ
ncbi:TetR/AcrR family transcriptional regulator [Burkholderia ubonensis]|uniref:TetR family transcriptional regulator n=1 Tax=Burkholderia ubonensis subsp. mesacidophila TaxID=265293 RepID=A0A2A4FBQ3_9BURK|nr:TetR/AcrR family transcriptional regulator [Burkholderia ubonensis]PCE30791.1 TetR family transcriptional regulator [Burkholderia ubonensis subsp. mesacidophila]